ncbi:MAG: hypothetical protein MH137_08425 [Flavobacteriales bacterium]|nr:hypothetical protein [Flavobacteriales bacterium]
MKTVNTLFLFLFISGFVLAQPSAEQVRADVKKQFPTAINIEVVGAGTTKTYVQDGAVKTSHERAVKFVTPSTNKKFPNAKGNHTGSMLYNKNGSVFSFNMFGFGAVEITGMPDPKKEEVLPVVNASKNLLLKADANRIIGTPGNFDVAPGTKYVWKNFDDVEFEVVVKFERFINDIGDAETVNQKYRITLQGKDGENWQKVHPSFRETDREVLSTKKYSQAERANMKTYDHVLATEEAEKVWAQIKPMNVPDFKDMYEAMDFMHPLFMEGTENSIRNLLYNMLSSSYFRRPDFKVPTQEGTELMNSVMTKVVTGEFLYRDQYCSMPEVKETGTNSIDWWNKDKSAYSRITMVKEEGKWKIGGITMYLISELEKANRVASVTCSKSSLTPIERGERAGVSSLKANDVVLAYYESDGLWYPSFYLSYSNYYYSVQYFVDNKKGMVRKVIPCILEPGDKALVKTTSGGLAEVTIVSINKFDVVIESGGQQINYKMSGLMFKK